MNIENKQTFKIINRTNVFDFSEMVEKEYEIINTKPYLSHYISDEFEIYYNGEIIDIQKTIVKENAVYERLIAPEKGSLAMVGQVIGTAIGLTIGFATGQWGLAFKSAAGVAAIFAGVDKLKQLLYPNDPEEFEVGWDGAAKTSVQQGTPVPVLYGTYKLGGNVIAKNIIKDGDEQKLDLLLALTDHYVSDIDNDNVTVNGVSLPTVVGDPDSPTAYAKLGTNDQTFFPAEKFYNLQTFTDYNNQVEFGSPLTGIVTQGNLVQDFQMHFAFRRGVYFTNDGDVRDRNVTITISYKKVGDPTFTSKQFVLTLKSMQPYNFTVKGSSLDPTFWEDAEPAQYEFQISKDNGDANTNERQDSLWFESLEEIVKEELNYPNRSLLVLKNLDAKDFAGSVPNVNVLVTRGDFSTNDIFIEEYLTETWINNLSQVDNKNSNNPAWAVLDILTNKHYSDAGYTIDNIDTASFETYARFCEANNLECNSIFVRPRSCMQAALKLLAEFSGILIFDGDTIKISIDEVLSEPTQLFSDGNILKGSFTREFISPKDLANAVQVTFVNAGHDYVKESFRIINYDTWTATNEVIKPLTFTAITDYTSVCKQANIALKHNEYSTEIINFKTDLDSLKATISDLIAVSHSTIDFGTGKSQGRFLKVVDNGASNYTITFSEPFDVIASNEYAIVYTSDNNVMDTVNFTASSTETISEVTLTVSGETPNIYNTYAVHPTTETITSYKVASVQTSTDLIRTITAMKYDTKIYDSVTPPTEVTAFNLDLSAKRLSANLYTDKSRYNGEPYVQLTWGLNAEQQVDTWKVYYRIKDSGAPFTLYKDNITSSTVDIRLNFLKDVEYEFTVAGKNTANLQEQFAEVSASEGVLASVNILPPNTPDDISNPVAVFDSNLLNLSWDKLDFDNFVEVYEIRRNVADLGWDDAGTEFFGSTKDNYLTVDMFAEYGTSGKDPYYYYIKAKTTQITYSVNATTFLQGASPIITKGTPVNPSGLTANFEAGGNTKIYWTKIDESNVSYEVKIYKVATYDGTAHTEITQTNSINFTSEERLALYLSGGDSKKIYIEVKTTDVFGQYSTSGTQLPKIWDGFNVASRTISAIWQTGGDIKVTVNPVITEGDKKLFLAASSVTVNSIKYDCRDEFPVLVKFKDIPSGAANFNVTYDVIDYFGNSYQKIFSVAKETPLTPTGDINISYDKNRKIFFELNLNNKPIDFSHYEIKTYEESILINTESVYTDIYTVQSANYTNEYYIEVKFVSLFSKLSPAAKVSQTVTTSKTEFGGLPDEIKQITITSNETITNIGNLIDGDQATEATLTTSPTEIYYEFPTEVNIQKLVMTSILDNTCRFYIGYQRNIDLEATPEVINYLVWNGDAGKKYWEDYGTTAPIVDYTTGVPGIKNENIKFDEALFDNWNNAFNRLKQAKRLIIYIVSYTNANISTVKFINKYTADEIEAGFLRIHNGIKISTSDDALSNRMLFGEDDGNRFNITVYEAGANKRAILGELDDLGNWGIWGEKGGFGGTGYADALVKFENGNVNIAGAVTFDDVASSTALRPHTYSDILLDNINCKQLAISSSRQLLDPKGLENATETEAGIVSDGTDINIEKDYTNEGITVTASTGKYQMPSSLFDNTEGSLYFVLRTNTTTSSGTKYFFDTREQGESTSNYMIFIQFGVSLQFEIISAGSAILNTVVDNNILAEDIHVCLTYKANDINFYLNGEFIEKAINISNISDMFKNFVCFGSNYIFTSFYAAGNTFKQISGFKEILTADKIKNLYNNRNHQIIDPLVYSANKVKIDKYGVLINSRDNQTEITSEGINIQGVDSKQAVKPSSYDSNLIDDIRFYNLAITSSRENIEPGYTGTFNETLGLITATDLVCTKRFISDGIAINKATTNKIESEGSASQDWTVWNHWNNTSYWSSNSEIDDSVMGKVFKGVNANASTTFFFDHDIYNFTNGSKYSISIYIKADSYISGINFRCYFRDSADTIIYASEIYNSLTTEWKRYTFTIDYNLLTSSGNGDLGFPIDNLPVGTEIYAAYPQLEVSDYPTSFVKGIRATGKLEYPTTLVNPSRGSILFKLTPEGEYSTITNTIYTFLDTRITGSTSAYLIIRYLAQSSVFDIAFSDGTTSDSISSSAITSSSDFNKKQFILVTYETGSIKFYLNNELIGTSTANIDVTTFFKALNIGSSYADTQLSDTIFHQAAFLKEILTYDEAINLYNKEDFEIIDNKSLSYASTSINKFGMVTKSANSEIEINSQTGQIIITDGAGVDLVTLGKDAIGSGTNGLYVLGNILLESATSGSRIIMDMKTNAQIIVNNGISDIIKIGVDVDGSTDGILLAQDTFFEMQDGSFNKLISFTGTTIDTFTSRAFVDGVGSAAAYMKNNSTVTTLALKNEGSGDTITVIGKSELRGDTRVTGTGNLDINGDFEALFGHIRSGQYIQADDYVWGESFKGGNVGTEFTVDASGNVHSDARIEGDYMNMTLYSGSAPTGTPDSGDFYFDLVSGDIVLKAWNGAAWKNVTLT